MDRNTRLDISPEVRKWVTSAALSGHSGSAILKQMVATGWPEALAIETIKAALSEEPVPGSADEIPVGSPVPEPDVIMRPSVVSAGDRNVRVLATMNMPRTILYGGLLSVQECKELIKLARPKLTRSMTIDRETGGGQVNAVRTSEGMFFTPGENALVARVEARIAALIQWPTENGEGLQILRYGPGQEYQPHHDFFTVGTPATEILKKRGGQRVASVVMYLNTPIAGGGTLFADVGLEIAPQRGNAVFFSYDRPHSSTKTLHGGSPVYAGEKWVATKWYRERAFDQ